MFRTVAKEELRVPGRVEYLGELRDFVTRVGRKYKFSDRIINAFKLSIDEAATNIIKHAYRDWEGDITLRAVVKKDTLTIILTDQGKYFDPRKVSSPDLQRYVEIGKKGGLGIFIMKRLLDSIDYRKTEGGNELWMVKKRDEVKKKRISIGSIPLSLKMRYWLYSLVIFTTILAVISFINFVNTRQQILDDYTENGRAACESLNTYLKDNWDKVDPETFKLFKWGANQTATKFVAEQGIVGLEESDEYKDILSQVILTTNRDEIFAASDSSVNDRVDIEKQRYVIDENLAPIREFENSKVFILTTEAGQRVLDILWPVWDDDGEKLANIHFQVDHGQIRNDIGK